MSFTNLIQRFKIIFLALILIYAFVFGTSAFYVGINPDVDGIFRFFPGATLYSPPPKNYVTKWEHDIVALKNKIPAGQTRLGYLADWDLFPNSYSPDQYVFYYLTQYSLAPIFIDSNSNNEWIILYTSEPKPKAWLDAHLKPYTIESIGFRFFLIHQNMSK